MPKKSYVTSMPDKTGAFLLASRIIARHGGNIVRVSYNKAVDLHTLFLDVEAQTDSLDKISRELESVGYLNKIMSEVAIVVVVIKIPDSVGSLLPVLKILDRYDINISYINSSADASGFQNFKMGLLIENPGVIKMLLDEISELYRIDILDYNSSEENLDNTVFYIRLANEMHRLLDLSQEKTTEFISESNRILQSLQDKGENPNKVFEYIRKFAHFIKRHKDGGFAADVQRLCVSEGVTLYSIQPPCGSNTYVFDTPQEYVLIDTGYAIFADEMFHVLSQLFPDWDTREKRVFITHADVDHCGLLSKLENVRIYMNKKSADSLRRQSEGIPDYRENSELSFGYSKLSRIISGYTPPDTDKITLLDRDTPEEHEVLLHIADFSVSDMLFNVYEGSGGHLNGEMVFVSQESGIIFTGDNLVNISGFSPERAEFNSLAPYLMRSVNVDSVKAVEVRRQIVRLIGDIEEATGRPCVVCGGHGPVSIMSGGRLASIDRDYPYMSYDSYRVTLKELSE
ncbi:MAG: MBL fold metallo-hydrolase [Eubacteriales bacterium]